jgi:ribosomal protein S27E
VEIPTDDVIAFPSKLKPVPGKAISVAAVSYKDCRHLHTEIDPKRSEVKCLDCKVLLNPIWLLEQLSREDERLFRRWAELRATIQSMNERTKTKCKHCGKMTPIPHGLSHWETMQRGTKIIADENK